MGAYAIHRVTRRDSSLKRDSCNKQTHVTNVMHVQVGVLLITVGTSLTL